MKFLTIAAFTAVLLSPSAALACNCIYHGSDIEQEAWSRILAPTESPAHALPVTAEAARPKAERTATKTAAKTSAHS